MLKGIDVSHHNGTPDFAKAKAAGVAFVYVKATEGVKYADPMFQPNMFNAMKAGLPVGAYHFARPNNRAEDEANHFVDTISIFKYNLLPVLDLEWAPAGMTGEELYQWARKFIETVQKRTGHRVMLYTGVWFLHKYPELKKLNDIPLWIAIYGRSEVPETGWQDWTVWQYTDCEEVPGVGKCDADWCKDLKQIMIEGDVQVEQHRKHQQPRQAQQHHQAKQQHQGQQQHHQAHQARQNHQAQQHHQAKQANNQRHFKQAKPCLYRVFVNGKLEHAYATLEKVIEAVKESLKKGVKDIVIKPRR